MDGPPGHRASGGFRPEEVPISGYDGEVIQYYVVILCEAGFLSCEPVTTSTDRVINASPHRLTWEGHEFLDAARDDSRCAQAQDTLRERGITVAFSVLQTLLTRLAKEELDIA